MASVVTVPKIWMDGRVLHTFPADFLHRFISLLFPEPAHAGFTRPTSFRHSVHALQTGTCPLVPRAGVDVIRWLRCRRTAGISHGMIS